MLLSWRTNDEEEGPRIFHAGAHRSLFLPSFRSTFSRGRVRLTTNKLKSIRRRMSTSTEPIQETRHTSDSLDNQDERLYTDQGISETIVQKLRSLIELGTLTDTDLDNRVCEQLRSFPDDLTSVDSLLDEFQKSDLTNVVNKGAFLCNLIKQWKIRNPQAPRSATSDSSSAQGVGDLARSQPRTQKPGPDEAKLKVITRCPCFAPEQWIELSSKFSIEQATNLRSLLVNANTVDLLRMDPIDLHISVKYASSLFFGHERLNSAERILFSLLNRSSSVNFLVKCSKTNWYPCAKKQARSGI